MCWQPVVWLAECDEIRGYEMGALVQQLKIGVLAVGAGRAPYDR